jgi:RimJ/RimL family protein N-acetyltransferase
MLDRFQSEPAVQNQIKYAGYLYFLLSKSGLNIGYMGLVPNGAADELFLSKIYIKKAERGNGYSREAVEFAGENARVLGLTKITLTVNKNNAGSIAAYMKMGFNVTGPVVTDIGSGFVMDDYRMAKYL